MKRWHTVGRDGTAGGRALACVTNERLGVYLHGEHSTANRVEQTNVNRGVVCLLWGTFSRPVDYGEGIGDTTEWRLL